MLNMTDIKTAAATGTTLAAPVLDPTARKFADMLAASDGPPIYTMTPEDARGVLNGLQAGPIDQLPADIRTLTLPVGPTGTTEVHVVRPQDASGRLPVIVYFHGGGWILGNFKTHERLIRAIANGAQAAVVFVDYESSPEAKYPVAIEQDYAVTKYVAEHGDEFDVDASRLAIAGDSVGGNMVAVVSLLAKERGGPKIALQVMFYPVTDAHMNHDSYETFAEGPWLSRAAMEWFWDAYLPGSASLTDSHISPLNASIEDLRGLPPALVITDENDVLRDEGEAYARKLMQAGVPTVATRYVGMIHDFVMLNPLSDAAPTRFAVRQATDALRSALEKQP
jgi:acetyl esterase